jgi:hypothetical protein
MEREELTGWLETPSGQGDGDQPGVWECEALGIYLAVFVLVSLAGSRSLLEYPRSGRQWNGRRQANFNLKMAARE